MVTVTIGLSETIKLEWLSNLGFYLRLAHLWSFISLLAAIRASVNARSSSCGLQSIIQNFLLLNCVIL